jgi:DNA processing protein
LALIKQGAKLVDCADDVLEELQLLSLGRPRPAQVAAGLASGADSERAAEAEPQRKSAADVGPSVGAGRRSASPAKASQSAGPSSAHGAALAPEKEDPVLTALGFDPISLDELVARTGRSAAELGAKLLEFELGGRVARLPGSRFQRLVRG